MKPTIIILAAGENTRFFPLDGGTHKGAYVLCGKPLIVRTIDELMKYYFDDIVVVVSPHDESLQMLLNEQYGEKIRMVVQPTAKGMGDAVLKVGKVRETFGILFPYAVHGALMMEQLIHHARKGGALALSYTKTPWLYGVASVEDGKVTNVVEKPKAGSEPSNLKLQQAYYLSKEFIEYVQREPEAEYSFESALSKFVKDHPVAAVEHELQLPSLKYPWHLFEFANFLRSSLHHHVAASAVVASTAVLDEERGKITIEAGAHIGHCARIVGPSYIGADAYVGDFSLVRESSLEKGAQIGAYAEVARSIVGVDAHMHSGFIGDSIVGEGVRLGAGFISANKRLDRGEVHTKVRGEMENTELAMFGTVIGAHTTVGVGVRTMPGILIGANSTIYPGLVIHRNIDHASIQKD